MTPLYSSRLTVSKFIIIFFYQKKKKKCIKKKILSYHMIDYTIFDHFYVIFSFFLILHFHQKDRELSFSSFLITIFWCNKFFFFLSLSLFVFVKENHNHKTKLQIITLCFRLTTLFSMLCFFIQFIHSFTVLIGWFKFKYLLLLLLL